MLNSIFALKTDIYSGFIYIWAYLNKEDNFLKIEIKIGFNSKWFQLSIQTQNHDDF